MFAITIALALLATSELPQPGEWEIYTKNNVFEGRLIPIEAVKLTWLDQKELGGQPCRLLEYLPLHQRTLEPQSVEISGQLWALSEKYLRAEVPWEKGMAAGWWYKNTGVLEPKTAEALQQQPARQFYVPGFLQDAKDFAAPAQEITVKKKKIKLTKAQQVVRDIKTSGGSIWKYTITVWPHPAGPGGVGIAREKHEIIAPDGKVTPKLTSQYELLDYGAGGKQTIKLP